jgi:hypothetical protein
MSPTRIARAIALLSLLAAVPAAAQQFGTPNTIFADGPFVTDLGGTRFVNYGLQGVGRLAASTRDIDPITGQPGETLGSVSGLQLGNWSLNNGVYSGTFYTLPDRGYNAAGVFSDYAARIQSIPFTFTPYTGSANIGGTTLGEKVAAQSQIVATYQSTTLFTYGNRQLTTGLDPGANTALLFGKTVPLATSQTIGGANVPVNRLSMDAEGLALKPDGSGYVSDEYGPNIYYFNASKQIQGVLGVPQALVPRSGGAINFNSINPPTDSGRRNNQGMEAIALSPDGSKLYGLMQSATVQDSTNNQATRLNTRLLEYDLSGGPIPSAPTKEYVLQLPTFSANGNGTIDRTAAQSEIVALGDGRLLVLSRDGQGLGTGNTTAPIMYKSILLVDTKGATNIAGTGFDTANGAVSPGGVLDATVTPLTKAQVLNMLNTKELARFNFDLDTSTPDSLLLSEKWEGLALVPALDPERPNDYFLFVANDNDFQTRTGFMLQADGTFNQYDAGLENDTVFLAYRVSIGPVPEPSTYAMLLAGLAVAGFVVRRRLC